MKRFLGISVFAFCLAVLASCGSSGSDDGGASGYVPRCGNGKIESGEVCDGDVECCRDDDNELRNIHKPALSFRCPLDDVFHLHAPRCFDENDISFSCNLFHLLIKCFLCREVVYL